MSQDSDQAIEQLIPRLDSLLDGDRAAAMLVAIGAASVPHLERYLLSGLPRTIALPRCRAVRALGELGARETLISYFRDLALPEDSAILFAEDAVRSEAAQELLRWKTDETFAVLLAAIKTRATAGLVRGLGEFQRPEAVPVFFDLLEDDLCREESKEALLKVPEAARCYAILLLRGATPLGVGQANSLRRKRATFQLLAEFGVSQADWKDLRGSLGDQDTEVVIACAEIGLNFAPVEERRQIFEALLRVSHGTNWEQEERIATLLDTNRELASALARVVLAQHEAAHKRPNWLDPSWRMLRHVLGDAAIKKP